MKIRRSHDRFIFMIEISIYGNMAFILRQGPAQSLDTDMQRLFLFNLATVVLFPY